MPRTNRTNKRAPDRSRAMLQALIEGAPDLLTLIDRDRVVRYVSPAVTQVTGYESGEVLGRPFLDLLHPDDVDSAQKAFNELLTSRDVRMVRTCFHRKDGRWITLESLARAAQGFPAGDGVLVSSRDVTQHVELEATLRKSEQESAELFEGAPCGYHSLDGAGTFRRVNRTELRWLQRTREELVGRKAFVDLVVHPSRGSFAERFAQLKQEGALRDAELDVLRKDGTSFPVLLQSVAVRSPDGEFVASRTTLYDITERKTAESALRNVNRALLILNEARRHIIHARTESELLAEICRLVVEGGGYLVAAVFFAQKDAGSTMRLVAKAGDDRGYLQGARISWADEERGQGPAGRAVRLGTLQVSRDFLADVTMAPWRDLALSAGARSSASLPLRDLSGVFGALSIFAREADAFEVGELGLLNNLADEVSFAIGSLLAERFAAEHKALKQLGGQDPTHDPLSSLSARERQVLKEVAQGHSSKEIAAKLGIAPASVDTYRSRLMLKLKIRGVSELVRFAIRAGIVMA